MYKIILLGLVSLMFIGCATNGVYHVSKTVYIKGKEVVIENYDSLDEDTKRKLEAIDELAIKYDETRGKVVDGKDEKQWYQIVKQLRLTVVVYIKLKQEYINE